MAFKLLADHFSITRDSNHFIQLKTLKHPHTSDEVWVAFAVEGESKFGRATVQDLIDTFEESFFEQLEIKPYERFENALREVNLIYKNIKNKRGPQAVNQLSGLIAVFSGTELHLTQCNEAEAYLIRKEKLSHISEGLASQGDDLFVNIASGELIPEDMVLFSTARLLRYMSQSQVVNSCRNGVTEAIDSIREYMMEANDVSLGVNCIHVQLPHRNPGKIPRPTGGWIQKFNALWEKALESVSKKDPNQPDKKDPMRRNTLLAAILGIILILIISITFLMESRHDKILRQEYAEKIEGLKANLNTATVQGVGEEKANANALLDQVEQEAKKILETEFFNDEVVLLLEQVKLTRDEINNALRIVNPSPYVDLTQEDPEVSAIGMTRMEENLYAFGINTLYEIILDQPLDPKNAGENEVLLYGASMEDLDHLVFLTQSGRVVEYDGNTFDAIDTQDESWKEGVDVATFDRFFYILSPQDSQIYRYSRGNSTYSAATDYVSDVDLESALSMAIDGSIYVLKQGGEILKLFRGELEDFQVENVAVDLSGANEIFTLPELNYLYVLDSTNQRVVVLEKEAGLGARYWGLVQFEFEDPIELKSLDVDQEENTLYVLGKTALYTADLRELNLK